MIYFWYRFEYDTAKSAANRSKHGISLEQAQQLWGGPSVTVAARSIDEERWMIIGRIESRLYSCVYTERGNVIRLISARRSRENEERIYHEQIQKNIRGEF